MIDGHEWFDTNTFYNNCHAKYENKFLGNLISSVLLKIVL